MPGPGRFDAFAIRIPRANLTKLDSWRAAFRIGAYWLIFVLYHTLNDCMEIVL
jgi:hypothetical protein